MATTGRKPVNQVLIDFEPELRRRVELAAGGQSLSVPDYVVTVIRRAVDIDDAGSLGDPASWSRLAAGSFARDWASEEDKVYDGLS